MMLRAINAIVLAVAFLAVSTHADEEYKAYFIKDRWDAEHIIVFELSLDPKNSECPDEIKYEKRFFKVLKENPYFIDTMMRECYECCGQEVHYAVASGRCECLVPPKANEPFLLRGRKNRSTTIFDRLNNSVKIGSSSSDAEKARKVSEGESDAPVKKRRGPSDKPLSLPQQLPPPADNYMSSTAYTSGRARGYQPPAQHYPPPPPQYYEPPTQQYYPSPPPQYYEPPTQQYYPSPSPQYYEPPTQQYYEPLHPQNPQQDYASPYQGHQIQPQYDHGRASSPGELYQSHPLPDAPTGENWWDTYYEEPSANQNQADSYAAPSTHGFSSLSISDFQQPSESSSQQDTSWLERYAAATYSPSQDDTNWQKDSFFFNPDA